MRWSASAVGLAIIALTPAGLLIGCAGITVWEVRPEPLARAVRHGLGQHPLGVPAAPIAGTGTGVGAAADDARRPPAPDASLARASAAFDQARRREHLGRDDALRLYGESMALAWSILEIPAPAAVANDPARTHARALYNRSLDRFLRLSGGQRFRLDASWRDEMEHRGIRVAFASDPSLWAPDRFDELRFAGDYVVAGMAPYYGSDGLGVPLVAVRSPSPEDLDRRQGPDRFLPYWEVYPVTAILRFAPTAGGPPNAVLELHDTLRSTHLGIGGGWRPLAADLTTPTAFHFARSRLSSYERISLFTPQQITRPRTARW